MSLIGPCTPFLLPLTYEHPKTGHFHFLLLGPAPCTCTGVKEPDPDIDEDGDVIVSIIVIWVFGSISFKDAGECWVKKET